MALLRCNSSGRAILIALALASGSEVAGCGASQGTGSDGGNTISADAGDGGGADLALLSNEGPALTASPTHGNLFGEIDVTFSGDLGPLGNITSVLVGGVHAYNLRATSTAITVTLQGAPVPGPADVIVDGDADGDGGRAVSLGLYTYDAPPTGVPLKWMAFGASLTQGTESNGIDGHTQLLGVSSQVARAAGVYMPPPLFVDNLFTPLEITDFHLDCTQKPDTGVDPKNFAAVLDAPTTHLYDLRRGRIDPTLVPQNIAIGGTTVAEILTARGGLGAIIERVAEEPDSDPGDVFSPVDTGSQIDRIERYDPDVGICTDLLANDLDKAVTQTDDLHPELITDLSTVTPKLAVIASRLGKLHGQYFLANMPSFTFLPNVAALREKVLAADPSAGPTFDAKVQAIVTATAMYDAALVSAIAPYSNLHLVDFKASVDTLSGGVTVGGEALTVAHFGGLLSLDDLHFTDTGYALYANVYIDALNQVLGTDIPMVDADTVHSGDDLAPAKLRADGFTCVPSP